MRAKSTAGHPSQRPAIAAGDARAHRSTVLSVMLGLVAMALVLRLPYAGHLYQDDGLWFTAAEEVLRGKVLYSDIYFDKPPALPLLYAGLFELFGAHIITIRLFTILYSIAIAGVLFLFGSWLYDRRAGLTAASIFTLFSTTYETGHFQGLNTDFLMALPYAVAAYLFARSCGNWFRIPARVSEKWYALGGGLALGLAFQANPKAAFGLLFFAALLALASRPGRGALLFALSLAGFVLGAAPLFVYVAANRAMSDYWQQVWVWGSRYAAYNSVGASIITAIAQTADYFAVNNLLLLGLIVVAAGLIRGRRVKEAAGGKTAPGATYRGDAAVLLWLAVSYAGMSVGGRFYGHYFFQILPALSLIAARGILGIAGLRQPRLRRAVVWLAVAGLALTLARSHGRTLVLAGDWLRGMKSESTLGWFHERLNHEERMVAAVVRHVPGGSASAGSVGLEEMRGNAPASHLFVWGYRPEIYFWSGLPPVSMYLSSQPLTGVPADIHYFKGRYRPVLGEGETRAARARLLGELDRTRPEFIIDELGVFNSELSMSSFADMRECLARYRELGRVGRFVVYLRKDLPDMLLSGARR